jgi:hypothetical protein
MALQAATTTTQRRSLAIDRDALGRVGAVAAGSIFLVAGMGLVGLGTAIPMVLGIAAANPGPPPADLATALRIEPFWWVFAALGIVNLVAAFAAPAGRRSTDDFAIVLAASTSVLVAIASLSATGPAAIGLGIVAGAYLVAALGTVLVPRRS